MTSQLTGTTHDLDWIDRFCRSNRQKLHILEEDRGIYVFPDFSLRSNMSVLRILKTLFSGQRVGAFMAGIGDTTERRGEVATPFKHLNSLLTEPLPASSELPALTNMLYSRAHHTRPAGCEIALTWRCTLDCLACGQVKACTRGNGRCGEEQSAKHWRDVFRKLVEEGNMKGVTLTGGEPLMHRDFLKTVKFAQAEGLSVHVVTSGELLTEKVAHKLERYGTHLVTLKLIAAAPKLIEAATGSPAHMEAVKTALKSLSDHGLPTRLYAVLSPKTAPVFSHVLEWTKRNHVKELMIELAVPQRKEQMVPLPQLNRWIKAVTKHCAEHGVRVLWLPTMPICLVDPVHKGALVCNGSVAEGMLHVAPDGSCLVWPGSAQTIGNIMRQSIEEIWRDARAKRFRTTNLYPVPCKRCAILGMCRAASPWLRPLLSPLALRPNLKRNWRGEEDFADSADAEV